MQPEQLAAGLQRIYDEQLIAVLLYGSAARGDAHKAHSDVNVLVVLHTLAPAALQRANPLIRKWTKAGHPAPVFFDPDLIERSADVFPMEFQELLAHRRLLCGRDPFVGVTVADVNLRHQCEHDLRSKLLQLVAAFIVNGNRPRGMRDLICKSASNFFAIFRGVVRLTGAAPAPDRRAVVEQLTALADVNGEIFHEILDVREGTRVWRNAELPEKFEQYLTVIRGVIRFVDRYAGAPATENKENLP